MKHEWATKAAAVLAVAGLPLAGVSLVTAAPLAAQDTYRNKISNDMRQCAPGNGPAVRVTVTGIKSATGNVRIQVYYGTKADWLEKGKWINRIEVPARQGRMVFCMPVPEPGSYAIALRHDANDNNETDIFSDGGAMSNNPSINIFNLGKPGIDKTRFEVGPSGTAITIRMRYFG